MRKFFGDKGQTAIEMAMLVVVLVGALIVVQNYFKRGIQGRWKSSVDGIGEQYDPFQTTVDIRHGVTGSTLTNITTQSVANGVETMRADTSTMTETKTGTTRVDAF